MLGRLARQLPAAVSWACNLQFHHVEWLRRRPFACIQMHPSLLLQALGSVFQELIFSALSTAGPSEITSGAALQRLLTDVFQGSIHEFK